jgi:hypothetical protein
VKVASEGSDTLLVFYSVEYKTKVYFIYLSRAINGVAGSAHSWRSINLHFLPNWYRFIRIFLNPFNISL